MNSGKTILPSLRNIEWKTLTIETNKINHILPYIPTNNITELDELLYAEAKLVCENIGIPSKSTKKQQKPGWEIRLESQIKKTTKTSPNDEEGRWNKRWGEEGTGNMGKNNSTTWGNKPENAGQRRKIKDISTKGKTIQTKQDIPKQRKDILSTNGGSDTKTHQQPDAKETERFWAKIWEPKKHNENAEWINKITRELDGREEGAKMEIPVDLLKTILKRIIKLESARPWWNTWLLVQEIHFHSRKTSTRNEQMLTRHAHTGMDDQRKDYINPNGP